MVPNMHAINGSTPFKGSPALLNGSPLTLSSSMLITEHRSQHFPSLFWSPLFLSEVFILDSRELRLSRILRIQAWALTWEFGNWAHTYHSATMNYMLALFYSIHSLYLIIPVFFLLSKLWMSNFNRLSFHRSLHILQGNQTLTGA